MSSGFSFIWWIIIAIMLMFTSCSKDEGQAETAANIEQSAVAENETTIAANGEQDIQVTTESETFRQPEIKLIMVGDILLHDRMEKSALQADGTYNYDRIFDDMEDEIKAADVAIVNQEVIIGGRDLGISGYPCFNADFQMGEALVKSGFDVVCHGTNHALDKNKKGLLSCIRFWKETYPQIAVLGINETEEEYKDIYIYEKEGVKIAILNYTYGTNGIPLPSGMPYAVDLLEKEKVVADIKKAEELADFTVVCPHWGTEYVLKQTKEQEKWVEIFFENGVDLVIGTHPHVIEPIEMIVDEAAGRKMLVYYSLGNFVNWSGESKSGVANRFVGGMAEVTISLDEGGNAMITDYGVTATVTQAEYGTDGVYTMKLSDYTEELAARNEVRKQDSVFTKQYCTELCNKVWGDLWE